MLKLENFQDVIYIHSDWLWLIVALPLFGTLWVRAKVRR